MAIYNKNFIFNDLLSAGDQLLLSAAAEATWAREKSATLKTNLTSEPVARLLAEFIVSIVVNYIYESTMIASVNIIDS